MRLALALAVLLLAGAVSRAEALTIRDVIELTKAGISDEVLLALIDVDGGVYASDAGDPQSVERGRRERAGHGGAGAKRPRAPAAGTAAGSSRRGAAAPPQVVVIEHHEPRNPGSAGCRPGPRLRAGLPGPPRSHRTGDAVHDPRPREHVRAISVRPAGGAPGARRPHAGLLGIRREAPAGCLGPAGPPTRQAIGPAGPRRQARDNDGKPGRK